MSQAREEGYKVPEKKAGLSMEVADIIIKAALDCPSCFNKVVAYVNSMRKKGTLTDEESTTLKTLADKAKTTPLSPEEQTQMTSLSAKACQYVEEHEKKHHSEHEEHETPSVEEAEHAEVGKALAEMEQTNTY